MRRVLVFLVLASVGLVALVLSGGGVAGPAHEGVKPEIERIAAPDDARGANLPVSELPGGPKVSGNLDVKRMRSVSAAILREREWVDPLTGEKIPLPHYTIYSVHGEDVEPVRSDGPGAPTLRWRGVHVTVYRNVNRLSQAEARALASNPDARKSLVRYEIDAAEGTANFRLEASGEQESERSRRPPVVIHLLKDVRILVVSDDRKAGDAATGDTRITTSDVTIDEAAGTLEGEADVFADGPGFSAHGEGLRIDKAQENIEIRRNVTLDVAAATDDAGQARALRLGGGDFGSRGFRPRRVTTAGPVVVTQHGPSSKTASYEAILTDRVRVDGSDDSVLTAHRVILDLSPRDPRAAAAKPSAPTGARRDVPDTPQSARFELTRMVADGDVRVESRRRAEGARGDPGRRGGKAASDAARDRTVAIETDQMTVHFTGKDTGTALLEGLTTLRYAGALSLPGEEKRGKGGFVVTSCRDRLSYGPPSDAVARSLPCDTVVDLVGAVRIEGRQSLEDSPERLEAEHVRLYLRREEAGDAPPTKTARVGAPAAGAAAETRDEPRMVAVAFEATGGDVRILGPTVSGRARTIKAYDLDAKDGWGWRLQLAGPDATLEIAEPQNDAKPARDGSATAAAGKGDKPDAAKPHKPDWRLDEMKATGAVHGSLAQAGGDVPVTFEGDTLVYRDADGGELRAVEPRRAVLTYAGEKGRDSSISAPLVGFRLVDGVTRVWTRGEPGADSEASVYTGGRLAPKTPSRKGRATVALRGDSSIEASARLSERRQRLIGVVARDAASIERRVDAAPGSRISAASIEVALLEDDKPAGSPAPAGDAKAASADGRGAPAKSKPPAKRAEKDPEPTRWTLRSQTLAFEVATGDIGLAGTPSSSSGAPAEAGIDALRLLEARGHVRAQSDATATEGSQRLEGEWLQIRADGAVHRGRLEGPAGGNAVITSVTKSGDEELPQLIRSPRVDFELDGPTLAAATFAAPVGAVLHGATAQDGAAAGAPAAPKGAKPTPGAKQATGVERIVLKSAQGALRLDRDGRVTVEGSEAAPVSVVRTLRAPNSKTFSNEIRLSAPRLELKTTGSFGSGRPGADSFVSFAAEGPKTWVEATTATGGIAHASGDRLAYARATNRLELTGKDGVQISQPGFAGRGKLVWIDRATGEFNLVGGELTLEMPK